MELTGAVEDFDDDRGYGTIRGADGAGYFFHCTVIADGSRTIPVGQAVTFDVAPGRVGGWEATAVRPGS